MEKDNYGTLLKSIIGSINNFYQKDELAFLALTSKIENPLRDKIAFELQKKLGHHQIICREWTNNKVSKSKADIAILDTFGHPLCIIEFKAHSSIAGIGAWCASLENDIRKNAFYDQAEFIFVLFANHVSEMHSNQMLEQSIKYYTSLTKSVTRAFTLEDQTKAWKKALKRKNINSDLSQHIIDAGIYHDMEVKINTFVHENILLNEPHN